MRLVFIATGDIALPSFQKLLEEGPRPLALITQPDKPSGRHLTMTAPAIKTLALEANVPVLQPEKIGSAKDEIAALQPEVIVVMAYGQILPQRVLSIASRAIINLHASLLPRFRGAACIQAAIDAGDPETGITAMHVVRALDAGAMIAARSIAIHPQETGGSLHDRLAQLAPEVMLDALKKISINSAEGVPQDDAASSYIGKLERDDGAIDWHQSAAHIERRIRAYDPWPGTFTHDAVSKKRIKIFPPTTCHDEVIPIGQLVNHSGRWLIGCGSGALEIQQVQADGGRRMAIHDFQRGQAATAFF
ncbi:MAG: methionyl-tRNA formyltransferase [Verrucomicrobia bacterium]|nr:MAG: methionyl-tRNA formyltransferase [Verrucomicrobiota bacterium]